MFRQFKEKNKNLLRLKLNSALKTSGFVNEIYLSLLFINDTILYPLGGEGGYDENLK